MNSIDKFNQQLESLQRFIDAWKRETRQVLGLPEEGHSIGVSFDPNIRLDRLPGEIVIKKGLYKPAGYVTLQDNLLERVEVVQDSKDDTVIFRTFYEAAQELSSMSVEHFHRLYVPVAENDFPGRPRAPQNGV